MMNMMNDDSFHRVVAIFVFFVRERRTNEPLTSPHRLHSITNRYILEDSGRRAFSQDLHWHSAEDLFFGLLLPPISNLQQYWKVDKMRSATTKHKSSFQLAVSLSYFLIPTCQNSLLLPRGKLSKRIMRR